MTREEVEKALNVQETQRFGETKWFINRHIFDINNLLEEDKNSKNEID